MAGIYTGINAGAFSAQPQPQPQTQPVQVQPQYTPYGYGYYGGVGAPYAAAPAVPAASNQYYNPGTETIQGDTVQSGTFKGHGTGARIQGGFTASGGVSGVATIGGGLGNLVLTPQPAASAATQPQPNITATITVMAPEYRYDLYYNVASQNIEGITNQTGIFEGHATGATIQGPSYVH